jgi:hypothetical protein
MTRKLMAVALVAFSAFTLLFLAGPVMAQTQDPSLHQVYEAADAGRLVEAQAMMQRVLKDHPESSKAHFVEAQLLAKQGQYPAAGSELQTAERLAPGLPYAKPEAVVELRGLVASAGGARSYVPAPLAAPARRSSGVPWLLLLIAGGIVLLIVTLVRATRRLAPVGSQGAIGYMPGGPVPGVGPGMGGYPMGGYPMGGGGIGSGILGGLATGAAVGAGMVAGEELMHHFTDPNRAPGYIPPLTDSSGSVPDNLGGQDFGVSGGGWDDSGSSLGDGMAGGGGGDDWA